MEAYTGFAEVYDLFQDNVPYDQWCVYLSELLSEQGVTKGIVLDLGCGTGNVTERLAAMGFDMIGVDNSEDMLDIAMRKRGDRADSILYLCQDMRDFELYGTVAAVVSICDSMNYITEPEELTEVFRLVNNYLDPGGLFIFDLNTPYKYEELLAENTFAEVRDEGSFIWENYYDGESRINEYDLTLFIREDRTGRAAEADRAAGEADVIGTGGAMEAGGAGKELYRRYTETHYQRAYSLEAIRAAAEQAGLVWAAAYDAFTKEPVREDSERVYVVLRENGKRTG